MITTFINILTLSRIFIAMIIGRKEGYIQAEADMEEEIKDKLYQAFRGNRNQ